MNTKKLIDELTALVDRRPEVAHMPVTFGERLQEIEGGIVGRSRNDEGILNLSPVSLSISGEF